MWSFWLMAAGFGALGAAGALFYLFRQVRSQNAVQQSLAERTATVNRLLEFSQTIQGAGKPDQIFASLTHYLKSELGLWGLVILTNEADAVPAIELRGVAREFDFNSGAGGDGTGAMPVPASESAARF